MGSSQLAQLLLLVAGSHRKPLDELEQESVQRELTVMAQQKLLHQHTPEMDVQSLLPEE